MKDPKNLSELLNAQKNREEVTFSEGSLSERAKALLQECLDDIIEKQYIPGWEGYLIPDHLSQQMRTLKLLVDFAEAIDKEKSSI